MAANLIYVDVDGVLNPLGPSTEHSTYVFDLPYHGRVKVKLRNDQGEWLVNLAERTDSELVWCTMWEKHAAEHIAPIVGLPEMPFVPIEVPKMSASIGYMKAYSAVKYAEGRKFVAFEDEYDFQFHLEGSNGHQIVVDYDTGLQRSHINQAENYLLS